MTLDEQEQTSCEGLLTVKECHEALNGMDTEKSPGIDGLTAEFYIAFWAVLGSDLVEVLSYGFHHDQLSVSQHRGFCHFMAPGLMALWLWPYVPGPMAPYFYFKNCEKECCSVVV